MKRVPVSAAAAAAVVAASIAFVAAPPAQATHHVDSTPCTKRLISAHEGYTAHADGDTVKSQLAAFHVGVNIADSDVWITKDDYFVQRHDNDLSDSTTGTGLITESTLAQVLALRTKHRHEPIPTLDDFLVLPIAHEPGRWLMIETKFIFANHRYLDWLAAAIATAGMTDHVIIYSQYLDQVDYLKQIDPGLTVWYKALTSIPDPSEVANLNGVMIPVRLLTASVTQEFHDIGLTVIRERVDDEDQTAWKHFVRTGADGMMTADPVTAVAECKALP
jgi:glycerophosphoryl diester phosphodiesterase